METTNMKMSKWLTVKRIYYMLIISTLMSAAWNQKAKYDYKSAKNVEIWQMESQCYNAFEEKSKLEIQFFRLITMARDQQRMIIKLLKKQKTHGNN